MCEKKKTKTYSCCIFYYPKFKHKFLPSLHTVEGEGVKLLHSPNYT